MNKLRSKTVFAFAVVGFLVTSLSSCCFFEDGNREKGTPIESSEAAVKKIIGDATNNEGKRYSIKGYLNYSPGLTVYVYRPQTVLVNNMPGGEGETIATVEMAWSENGKNTVFVPENAERGSENTIFYDNEGKPISQNDKVEVSFEVKDASVYPVEVRIDKVK